MVPRTAQSLGVPCDPDMAPLPGGPTCQHRCPAGQGRQPRLRVLTYNVGGMSADLYDVFLDWLLSQTQADIVVIQETHWGMGKAPNTWTTANWHFISVPSPTERYAGVCICVSGRLAAAGDLEYQVYVPGRLVHVRLHGLKLSADIVGVYQWVLHSRSMDGNAANRSRLWSLLGKLLAALPRRNVLAIAGDLNTPACRLDIHVGSGVLQRRRQQDEEFHQLLRVHDLCLLNTWGSARAGDVLLFVMARFVVKSTSLPPDEQSLTCKHARPSRSTLT